MFTTTISAADVDTLVNEKAVLKTQVEQGKIVEAKTCSSSKGTVIAAVGCLYTVSWDEGIAGWVNNAGFLMDSAFVGGTSYEAEAYGTSWHSGSSFYQVYKIKEVNVYIRLSVTCDEWGNVTLGMVED